MNVRSTIVIISQIDKKFNEDKVMKEFQKCKLIIDFLYKKCYNTFNKSLEGGHYERKITHG